MTTSNLLLKQIRELQEFLSLEQQSQYKYLNRDSQSEGIRFFNTRPSYYDRIPVAAAAGANKTQAGKPKQATVAGKPKKQATIAGKPKQATVAGKPKKQATIAGKPKQATVAGKPKKQATIAGKPKQSTIAGKPKQSTIAGKPKQATISGKPKKEATIAGKPKQSTISGKPKKQTTIAGKPKQATIAGKPKSEKTLGGKPKQTTISGKPKSEKTLAGKPKSEKTLAGKPKSDKTLAGKPKSDKTLAGKPAAEKPAADKAGTEKPEAEKPAAEKPAAEKSAAEKTTTEKPAAEKTATATEKPATEKTGTEKPAAEKTATATEKPETATEKPAAEKSAAEKPATDKTIETSITAAPPKAEKSEVSRAPSPPKADKTEASKAETVTKTEVISVAAPPTLDVTQATTRAPSPPKADVKQTLADDKTMVIPKKPEAGIPAPKLVQIESTLSMNTIPKQDFSECLQLIAQATNIAYQLHQRHPELKDVPEFIQIVKSLQGNIKDLMTKSMKTLLSAQRPIVNNESRIEQAKSVNETKSTMNSISCLSFDEASHSSNRGLQESDWHKKYFKHIAQIKDLLRHKPLRVPIPSVSNILDMISQFITQGGLLSKCTVGDPTQRNNPSFTDKTEEGWSEQIKGLFNEMEDKFNQANKACNLQQHFPSAIRVGKTALASIKHDHSYRRK